MSALCGVNSEQRAPAMADHGRMEDIQWTRELLFEQMNERFQQSLWFRAFVRIAELRMLQTSFQSVSRLPYQSKAELAADLQSVVCWISKRQNMAAFTASSLFSTVHTIDMSGDGRLHHLALAASIPH